MKMMMCSLRIEDVGVDRHRLALLCLPRSFQEDGRRRVELCYFGGGRVHCLLSCVMSVSHEKCSHITTLILNQNVLS